MSIPITPELKAKILAKANEAATEDALAVKASTSPLPGALASVFAFQQDIVVGEYKVRPVYDIDFEFFAAIGHPLADMVDSVFKGQTTVRVKDYMPRGPMAWQAIYLFTRDPDTIERILVEKGAEFLKTEARAEFGKLQMGGLLKFDEAISSQIEKYWKAFVAYGVEVKEAGGSTANPPSTEPSPMGSVGSSPSGAA